MFNLVNRLGDEDTYRKRAKGSSPGCSLSIASMTLLTLHHPVPVLHRTAGRTGEDDWYCSRSSHSSSGIDGVDFLTPADDQHSETSGLFWLCFFVYKELHRASYPGHCIHQTGANNFLDLSPNVVLDNSSRKTYLGT